MRKHLEVPLSGLSAGPTAHHSVDASAGVEAAAVRELESIAAADDINELHPLGYRCVSALLLAS